MLIGGPERRQRRRPDGAAVGAHLAEGFSPELHEPEGEIAQRVETSRVELDAMNEFDHRVVNADVDVAVEDLTRVLASVLGEEPRG